MKAQLLLICMTFSVATVVAQTTAPRIPVYEVFSSSTCAPCRPANVHLTPIFEEYRGQIAVVKYQMSWPGTGDPYYTSEGNSRRNLYGINSVPYFVRNAEATAYSSFTTASVDDDLAEEAGMRMDLRYMINADSQSIRIRARIEVLQDYNDQAQRLLIPILERITTNNVKSNGETEFHNVFKKMLPEPGGQLIIQKLQAGDTFLIDTTYVFQGDYRLPADANSPINTSTEHSVENFDSLHVVMFMQGLTSAKTIMQGAVGINYTGDTENFFRPWGAPPVGLADQKPATSVRIYPNPVSDQLHIQSASAIQSYELRDLCGKLVLSRSNVGRNTSSFDTMNLPAGLYVLKVVDLEGEVIRKVVVE